MSERFICVQATVKCYAILRQCAIRSDCNVAGKSERQFRPHCAVARGACRGRKFSQTDTMQNSSSSPSSKCEVSRCLNLKQRFRNPQADPSRRTHDHWGYYECFEPGQEKGWKGSGSGKGKGSGQTMSKGSAAGCFTGFLQGILSGFLKVLRYARSCALEMLFGCSSQVS